MAADYQKYMIKNMVFFGEHTECTDSLLARCVEKNIIHITEKGTILEEKSASRGYKFWSVVMSRHGMDDLIEIFDELNQKPIAQKLRDAKGGAGNVNNLSPLTVQVVKPLNEITHENNPYKLKYNQTGMALIINVIEYEDHGYRRHGAVNDSDYMSALWGQLGYVVTLKKQTSFKDEDIRRIVHNFVKEAVDSPHMQSFVVFIGCHGKDGNLYMSDRSRLDLFEDIVFTFDVPELKGKPKLFFIQACQYFPESGSSFKQDVVKKLENMEDTAICLSALPGQGANRDIYLGSFYVYTLADVLMREAYQTELQEMLNHVQEKMVIELKSTVRQIPYYVSYGLKKLYFDVRPED